MTVLDLTDPYPWPYDATLRPDRLALVICGAQRDLVRRCPLADDVLARLSSLAAQARAAGALVLWVRHGHGHDHGNGLDRGRRARSTVLPSRDSAGWTLAIDPSPEDELIDAAGWDGTYASTLEHELRRTVRTHVVLGGVASELTVDSTVRTLNDRGFECLVLTDGCAPIDAELGTHAHASLTMSGGIFGALGTLEALQQALALVTTATESSSR